MWWVVSMRWVNVTLMAEVRGEVRTLVDGLEARFQLIELDSEVRLRMPVSLVCSWRRRCGLAEGLRPRRRHLGRRECCTDSLKQVKKQKDGY
jgi:hypothetical protein